MTEHALRRFKERYNLNLTWKDIALIIKAISCNFGIVVKEENSYKTLWLLYGHCPIKVVFETKSRKIITALPFEIDEYNNLPTLKNVLSMKEKFNLEETEKMLLDKKFRLRHKLENLHHNLDMNSIKTLQSSLRIYTKSENYILIGRKFENTNSIEYAIYRIQNLKLKLNSKYKKYLNENQKENSKLLKKYLKRLEKY